MITKPSNGLAASGHPEGTDHDVEDLSDQIVVDSSQDVTVEASEESTLEIEDDTLAGSETPPPTPAPLLAEASMLTPPPTNMGAVARRGAPTLLGMMMPSLPLPGVTASSPARELEVASEDRSQPDLADDDDDEITVMARPSVTDDEEEATKVEPAETAIRAAASKDEDDELTAALSTQASVERERALRKSFPPSLDVPLSAHSYGGRESSADAEFADPTSSDDDAISLSTDTPGVVSVRDDDGSEDDDDSATGSYADADQEEPTSELEAVLAPRRPTTPLGGPSSFGNSPFSASAPLGRADGGFGGRLPTPSSGLGLTLPPSPSAPPPAASPFSARLAPSGAPYPRTMSPTQTGPMPALQIPAPSGAMTVASSPGILTRRVQVPLVGLLASFAAFLVCGLVVGGVGSRARTPAPAPVVVSAPAPAPAVTPLPPPAPAQAAPTPAPSAPVAAAPEPKAAPAAAPPAPTPPPAAAPPAEPAVAAATPPPAPRPAVKRAAARPAVKKVATSTGTEPKPARPAKAKVAKGWVDPFAE